MRQILLSVFIFLAIAGFAALLWLDAARLAARPSLVGSQAPLEHPLIGQGEPVLINFWFSTCAPCRAEHPFLMEIAEGGMPVIGVNRDVSRADAAAFLEELGDPCAAQVFDPRDEVAADFQIEAWPTTVLVAGNGVVQATYGPLIDPGAQADMRLISSPEIIFKDPVAEARAQSLFGLINCLDCDANTVRESGGNFALQMRKLVRQWLDEGRSEDEIREVLIARYGPQIWLEPPLNLTTALLYGAPFLVIFGGAFLLWRRGKKAGGSS